MIKRFFDIIFSICILSLFSPILVIAMLVVFSEDLKNPIYTAKRVGKSGRLFSMYKIRSMRVGADKSGVESTSSNDVRITRIGKISV